MFKLFHQRFNKKYFYDLTTISKEAKENDGLNLSPTVSWQSFTFGQPVTNAGKYPIEEAIELTG